jgi:hypothetical protein
METKNLYWRKQEEKVYLKFITKEEKVYDNNVSIFSII